MTLSVDQQADLSSLFYELAHNPKTRPLAARLVHEIDPQRARASFGDVIQEHRLAQHMRQVDDKLARAEAEKVKSRYDQQREALKERYSEEQLGEIHKEMTRIGTPDWNAGAILYAASHPEADPRYQPPPAEKRPDARWEFPTVDGPDRKPMAFKDFLADPRSASLNAAYSVISEFKNSNLSQPFRR